MIKLNTIIRDEDTDFSDLLSKINTETDLILCTHTNNLKVFMNELNLITLKTNKTISFSDFQLAGTGFEFASKCKICIPKHINLKFKPPISKFYYKHIYNYSDYHIYDHNIIYDNIRNVIIVEKDIMRMFDKMILIKKDDEILHIDVEYTINTIQPIQNFYLIEDDYVYDEFINHFAN